MTDTTTTHSLTEATAPIVHGPVAFDDFVGGFVKQHPDYLALQAELNTARAGLAATAVERDTARSEQITDGADPRLLEFWDKAGRIADHAGFCEEYDRLADAMNGTPRERDWSVTVPFTVTGSVSITVTARTEDEAAEAATNSIGSTEIADAVNYNWHGLDFEIDSDGIYAERD